MTYRQQLLATSSLGVIPPPPALPYDYNIVLSGCSNSEGADPVPFVMDGRPWAEIEAYLRRCEAEGRRFPPLVWTMGAPGDYDTKN